MLSNIPLELWAQVLAFLPYSSLNQAKRVNRAFYHICRAHLFEFLDLFPIYTGDNVGEQLEILKKRLSLATSHTPLITKIRFMGMTNPPVGYTPPVTQVKGAKVKRVGLLKRIFGKKKSIPTPDMQPEVLNLYLKSQAIDRELASLLPSFTSLHELAIGDTIMWPELWGPNPRTALTVAAHSLTVLSLQYPIVENSYGNSNNNFASVELPALRILKVFLGTFGINVQDHHVSQVISGSPLLSEIHYHVVSHGLQGITFFSPRQILAYPQLKVFKWTIANEIDPVHQLAASITLPPIFKAYAPQFDVVHINPAPSFQVIETLNIGLLVELRVDLNRRDDGSNFFALIAHAEQLETLEVTGFQCSTVANDPVNLFPATGLSQLRNLYLGIAFQFFDVQSLITLASKTPDIQKLVLLMEPWNNDQWTASTLRVKCDAMTREIHLLTLDKSLSDWKLLDIGILFQNWAGGIRDFRRVLMAISERVPSIASFYGTRGFSLWNGTENEISETWGGELWSQRKPKGWSGTVLV